MAQITTAEQARAAAERAVAKFIGFVEGLPADERDTLAVLMRQTASVGGAADDVTGNFFMLPFVVRGRSESGALDAVNAIDWQGVYGSFGIKPK